ncbi:uncharacterized protein BDW47DRAFT_124032 [Aspergillus candidus]|uniref:Uncharacterized protein n=1 Tax=Aspergillus candidus TaxID=41067 RepID=A0A2I2FHK0_ASPCN|nr:hypothetical protein BDW47DRAFT_124032 [Aspergillus candidus]PLB40093.1 hypothetical protein BDW47DRAFT_124032 [Aspergillus candidus]
MATKFQPEQQECPNGPHHGRLTITLRQTLSLTGNLLTLKLLHYLAVLLDLVPKPSQTNPYQPTPLRRHTIINGAIERRERRIVELFMAIIQMSLFETIFLHAEDGISPERISAAVAAFFSRTPPSASDIGSAMLRPGATATPAYARAPSPLRASVGQISSVASENRAGGSGSSGAPVPNFLNTRYSVQKPLISDSVYSSLFHSVSDTACVPGSSTLGVPMRKTPSGPSLDNNNINDNSGGGTGTGKEEAIVDSPAASLRPIYSIVCPVWSSDSAQSQSQSQSQGLEMTESGRTLSAGSYPGRFPVSDGVEFSSLATADGAVKGRAATSVRPLSDFGAV